MNTKELQEEIRKRTLQAVKNEIFEKATYLLERLGKTHEYSMEDMRMALLPYEKEIRFEASFDGINFAMDRGYAAPPRGYAWACDNLYIRLKPNYIVFTAEFNSKGPFFGSYASCVNRNQIVEDKEGAIYVHCYIPGDWEKALNGLYFRTIEEQEEKAQQERLQKEEEKLKKPLTYEEKQLAKEFGINPD